MGLVYRLSLNAGILIAVVFRLLPLQAAELSKLPYVPTPQAVVDEMLKLAAVNENDFLIDLGSGDGRIVITAAKQYKAQGFGVDIDGKLVTLSNRNAIVARGADRVKFFERDMFNTPIGKATVLTLYVMPDFMVKLRSKVLAELRPGTRVVAHDYHMGEWAPDRMITLTVPEKLPINGTDKAYLYLWVVPAIVKGDWRIFFDTGGKTQQLNVSFAQTYQMIAASGERDGSAVPVQKVSLEGDRINFGIALEGAQYRMSGTVDGDKIEGKAVGDKQTLSWLARRIP